MRRRIAFIPQVAEATAYCPTCRQAVPVERAERVAADDGCIRSKRLPRVCPARAKKRERR
jgi:hypothetical protein